MPPYRIPNTDRIMFYPKHIGDVVVDLNQFPEVDAAVAQEDVKEIGGWTDYSGSGGKPGGQALIAGIENVNLDTLQGQILDGDPNLSDRGVNKSVYRQRPKLVTIEVK